MTKKIASFEEKRAEVKRKLAENPHNIDLEANLLEVKNTGLRLIEQGFPVIPTWPLSKQQAFYAGEKHGTYAQAPLVFARDKFNALNGTNDHGAGLWVFTGGPEQLLVLDIDITPEILLSHFPKNIALNIETHVQAFLVRFKSFLDTCPQVKGQKGAKIVMRATEQFYNEKGESRKKLKIKLPSMKQKRTRNGVEIDKPYLETIIEFLFSGTKEKYGLGAVLAPSIHEKTMMPYQDINPAHPLESFTPNTIPQAPQDLLTAFDQLWLDLEILLPEKSFTSSPATRKLSPGQRKTETEGGVTYETEVTLDSGETCTVLEALKKHVGKYCSDPFAPEKGTQKCSIRKDGLYSHRNDVLYTIEHKDLKCEDTTAELYSIKRSGDKSAVQRRLEEAQARKCNFFTYAFFESVDTLLDRSLPSWPELLFQIQDGEEANPVLKNAITALFKHRRELALVPFKCTPTHIMAYNSEGKLDLNEASKIIKNSPSKLCGVGFSYGVGKTQGIAKDLAEVYGSSVSIFPREILARTTAEKLGKIGDSKVHCYKEDDLGQVTDLMHLCVCINSADRLYKDLGNPNFKLLIIDEASLMLRHIGGDSWKSSVGVCVEKLKALNWLKSTASRVEKIVLACADLTDDVMNAWQELLGLDNSIFIKSNKPPKQKLVQLHYSSRKDVALQKALCSIDSKLLKGRRVIVPVETKTTAIKIAAECRARGYNVLVVHGDIGNDQREKLTDIEGYCTHENIEVLIFNSAMGTGVSLENGHFDACVCIFSPSALIPQDYVQMMHRVRTIEEFEVFFEQSLRHKRSNEGFFDRTDISTHELASGTIRIFEAHCRLHSEDIFEYLLEQHNFKIEKVNHAPEIKSNLSSKELKKVQVDQIMRSHSFLQNRMPRTYQDVIDNKAGEVRSLCGSSTLKKEDVELFLSNPLALKLRHIFTAERVRGDINPDLYSPYLNLYTKLSNKIEESEVDELAQEFWGLRYNAIVLGLMPESAIKNHKVRHVSVTYAKSFIKKLSAHWGIKLCIIKKVSKEEAQRTRAWALFDDLKDNSAIARELDVDVRTVRRWRKKYQNAPRTISLKTAYKYITNRQIEPELSYGQNDITQAPPKPPNQLIIFARQSAKTSPFINDYATLGVTTPYGISVICAYDPLHPTLSGSYVTYEDGTRECIPWQEHAPTYEQFLNERITPLTRCGEIVRIDFVAVHNPAGLWPHYAELHRQKTATFWRYG